MKKKVTFLIILSSLIMAFCFKDNLLAVNSLVFTSLLLSWL